MQVSILNSVVTNNAAEFELSYPVNLEPVIVKSGISNGQLRVAAGTEPFAEGPGPMRANIIWNNRLFAVMASKLVEIRADRSVVVIGDVGQGDARLDKSFDRLIIRSGSRLYYYDGTSLKQVTDPDLGQVVDAIWVAGYTMATDGKFVLVTELTDPFEVKPTKYGSAEDDPDPVTGLIKLRDEVHVLGENTIQVFRNVGGLGFPFQTQVGATIPVGCVGAGAKCLYGQTYAFVGSSRGDALGVYVAGSGEANKISTRVVDDALAREPNPAGIVLERRVSRDELRLFVHLSAESYVFLAKASEAAGESVWYRCRSGAGKPYRLRYAIPAFGQILVGDTQSGAIGILTAETCSHFGETAEWMFDVGLLYSNGKGAIVDAVELIALTGRGSDAKGSEIFFSSTNDGQTFSPERAVTVGPTGTRGKRIQWRPHSRLRRFMGLRFRGYSRAVAGFATCEVTARPLSR